MYKYFMLLLCSICIYPLLGQGHTIFGHVLDDKEMPLSGANVYIPELQIGTVTSGDGSFRIEELPQGKFSLAVSYISYETCIISVQTNTQTQALHIHLHLNPIHGKEIVVSGGSYSSQHDNAIKIEAIKPAELYQSGALSYMQTLAQVAGVDFIGTGGAVSTPVIRGLATSNILYLNNGIRLENYQFSEAHPYLADEFGVGQVEIIKGPASLLYGSDAIGGVINSISEKQAQVGVTEGDASIRYYSNTNGIASTFGIKNTIDRFAWGLRAGVKSHEDFYGGGDQHVPNTRFNSTSVKAFTNYRIQHGVLRLYYEYQDMKTGLTNEESLALITNNGRKNEYWFQDLNNHLLIARNTFYSGYSKVILNASLQNNHRVLWGEGSSSGDELVDMRLLTINSDVRAVRSNDIGEYTIAVQGMSQNNLNAEAPNRVLPDYSLNDIAFFGMAKYDFFDRLHFQVGGRFDSRFVYVPEQEKSSHSHEEEHEEEEHDEEEALMDEFNTYYGNVSGSMGMTYHLQDGLIMRLNMASAYRSPNIAELTQDGEHGTRYEQGDRNLNSQRNYEADISFHYHKKKLLVDVSGYYNLIQNYIYLDYTSDTTDEGLDIYQYTQSNASIYGGEVLLEYNPIQNVGIKTSYAYIVGEKSNGDNLPFIPQNKISSEVKLKLKSKSNQALGAYLKFGTDYAFKHMNPSDSETATSDYLLLNLGVGMGFRLINQIIEVDVLCSNLLDTEYYDHLSTIKDFGYSNIGRNVSVSLKIPFKSK